MPYLRGFRGIGIAGKQTEAFGKGIKACLDKGSKDWLEEVLHVLWAPHTMIKSCNADTSFSLTYGTDVIILVEMRMLYLRCAMVDQVENDKSLLLKLDMLEEKE
ncbi:hypothetical protein Tco_0949048 [Tanacetum coccineum]